MDLWILASYVLAGALVAGVGYFKAHVKEGEKLDYLQAGTTVGVGAGLGIAVFFGLDLNMLIQLAAAYGFVQVANTAAGIAVNKIPEAQKFLDSLATK